MTYNKNIVMGRYSSGSRGQVATLLDRVKAVRGFESHPLLSLFLLREFVTLALCFFSIFLVPVIIAGNLLNRDGAVGSLLDSFSRGRGFESLSRNCSFGYIYNIEEHNSGGHPVLPFSR